GRVQFSLRSLAKDPKDQPPAVADAQSPVPAAAGSSAANEETLAGDPGYDTVSKTVASALPEPVEDDTPPTRGKTYTFDSEVSRLLGRKATVQVQVVQGSAVQQMTFDQ